MPISDGFMGNATSGIGQGLAYVLPATKTEDYAMQLAQQHSQQIAAQSAARIKRQQEIQDQLHKEFADQKLPDFYAPYDKAIIDADTAWKKKAADYSAVTGKSPFTDPDLMSEYNKNVIGLAKKSKEVGEGFSQLRAKAIADNGDKFTDQSVADVVNYEQEIKKDPMSALNKPMPQLKLRPVTEVEFDKTVTATPIKNNDGTWDITKPNLPAIKKQVYENAIADPKYTPLLEKYGYNPGLPDFPVYNAEGNRIWYTNPTFLEKTSTDILANPQKDNILQGFGISPDDPFVKEKLEHIIKEQNQAMGKFVTNRSDAIASKVTEDTTRVYTAEDQEMQRQAAKRSADANARAWGRYNDWVKEKATDSKFLEDVVNGNPEAVAEFKAHLMEINGEVEAFGNGLVVKVPVLIDEPVYITDKKGNKTEATDNNGKPITQKKEIYQRTSIPRGSGKAGQAIINQLLSKTKTYGAQKASKSVPYDGVSEEDSSALKWLEANPKSPQAGQVRSLLKTKGLIK